MRRVISSISVCNPAGQHKRFTVTICGARPMAARPGQSNRLTEAGGDKEWFTIDKTNGPGHGFQYQADDGINCSGGGVQFQRSTDGGVTWQAPISIPNSPIYGTLDVDTNGNLFVGGEGFSQFFCERSSNAQI